MTYSFSADWPLLLSLGIPALLTILLGAYTAVQLVKKAMDRASNHKTPKPCCGRHADCAQQLADEADDEDELAETITLVDDEGHEQEFYVLGFTEQRVKKTGEIRTFALLTPLLFETPVADEPLGVLVMEVTDGRLETITDEALAERIANIFLAELHAGDDPREEKAA